MRHDRKGTNSGKNNITIVSEGYSSNIENTINNAVRKDKIIVIEYFSREKGMTRRELEPMDIVYRMGKKNLVGWCRLRNDWRTFRIDRIHLISIKLEESFEPREDYRKENFEDETSQLAKNKPISNESDLPYKSGFAKTMTDNKLDFSNDEAIKTYSDDEEELSL